MYDAYNYPSAWREGCQFFTFASKDACSRFKIALTKAGMAVFRDAPAFGDLHPLKHTYSIEADVTWGYTCYKLSVYSGREIAGNYLEKPVPGMEDRYYLRMEVPGLDQDAEYWHRVRLQHQVFSA